jgi:hypothetical protein
MRQRRHSTGSDDLELQGLQAEVEAAKGHQALVQALAALNRALRKRGLQLKGRRPPSSIALIHNLHGTFHPCPEAKVPWVICSYQGQGPVCSSCSLCDCINFCEHGEHEDRCPVCFETNHFQECEILEHARYCVDRDCDEPHECHHELDETSTCHGLEVAFVCLKNNQVLCEDCAEAAGIMVVNCDCFFED